MLRAILPAALLLTAAASGCVFVFSPACSYAETDDFVLKGPSQTGASYVFCDAGQGNTAPKTQIAVDCGQPSDVTIVFDSDGPLTMFLRGDTTDYGAIVDPEGPNPFIGSPHILWVVRTVPEPGTGFYSVDMYCTQP